MNATFYIVWDTNIFGLCVKDRQYMCIVAGCDWTWKKA